MMRKTLALLFLCGITLMASAKYRKTCSIESGDTTKVVFNRIAFSIPEKVFATDTFYTINCNNSNGLMVLNFGTEPKMTIHYFQQGRAFPILDLYQEHCSGMPEYCTILEEDSTLVPNFQSRYSYQKSTNYSLKVILIYDPKFKMVYSLRIDSPLYAGFPDPYPRFKEIIKSITFLEE